MVAKGVRAAIGLALALVVLTWAGPAAAETDLEVTTPADGRFQPGQPTPLLVTISSDRAVSGTIRVNFDGYTAASSRVEVPGGSTKQVVLIATTPPWIGGTNVIFEADGDGDSAAGRLNLRPNDGDELVAVLPELAAGELPATADLDVEVGQARFFAFDPALLAEGPDVLTPFSHVAVTAGDLDALEPDALEVLEAWMAGSSGVLVVDEPAATPLPLAVTVPAGSEQVAVGTGQVRFTGGRLGAGDFDGALSPTLSRRLDDFPWGGGFGGPPVGFTLAQDAGIAIPGIGSLVLVLLAYALVVGPVAWFILRRSSREPLLWLAVPAAALVTTGAVYVVGLSLRNNATAAHATVVADLPGVRSVSTQVLVNSPNGGKAGIELPDQWRPARIFDESMFFDGPFGGGADRVEPLLEDGNLVAELPPGGVQVLGAESTAVSSDDPSWAVELTSTEDGVEGTVTNLTPHRLEEAFVTAGQGYQQLGTVEPGQSVEVSMRNTNVPPLNNDRFMESLWRFDPWGPQNDSPVNSASLISWINERPDLRAPGNLMVGGWTRDVDAPITTSRGQAVTNGRTLFVTVSPSEATQAGEPYRLELLRGWNSTRVTDRAAGQCTEFATTLRLAVSDPTSLGPDPVVDLSLRSVAALDVWTGSSWTAAGLADAPEDRVVAAVPPEALATGDLYLRLQLSCEFWNFANPFPDLRAQTGDDTVLVLGDLAGLGETGETGEEQADA